MVYERAFYAIIHPLKFRSIQNETLILIRVLLSAALVIPEFVSRVQIGVLPLA